MLLNSTLAPLWMSLVFQLTKWGYKRESKAKAWFLSLTCGLTHSESHLTTLPKSAPNTNLRPPPLTALQTSSKQSRKPIDKKRCFRFKGLGHYAYECPNKRVVTLAEYQASYQELEEHIMKGEMSLS